MKVASTLITILNTLLIIGPFGHAAVLFFAVSLYTLKEVITTFHYKVIVHLNICKIGT